MAMGAHDCIVTDYVLSPFLLLGAVVVDEVDVMLSVWCGVVRCCGVVVVVVAGSVLGHTAGARCRFRC